MSSSILVRNHYKYDTCDAQFSQNSCLIAHVRIHSVDKPHRCDTSSAQFSQNGSFKRHVRIHRGDRPFVYDPRSGYVELWPYCCVVFLVVTERDHDAPRVAGKVQVREEFVK